MGIDDDALAFLDGGGRAVLADGAVRLRERVLLSRPYVPMVLNMGLSPKDAWLRIRGSMEAHDEMLACAPFIDWLRVALTRQAANQPSRLATGHPTAPPMQAPAHMATLLGYRFQLVTRDIPALNSSQVTQGAQNIAQGLTALVSEQRLVRQEDQTRRRAEKNKNPSSFFGNDVLKLLRWCHVQDKALLPDIWKQLANAPKGQHRRVIQGAMDDTCEQLGFRNLNFQITMTVSKKVVGLEWVMHVVDDLSTGLHPFTVGYVTAEQAEAQRQRSASAIVKAICSTQTRRPLASPTPKPFSLTVKFTYPSRFSKSDSPTSEPTSSIIPSSVAHNTRWCNSTSNTMRNTCLGRPNWRAFTPVTPATTT
jgi:hypothetical protein